MSRRDTNDIVMLTVTAQKLIVIFLIQKLDICAKFHENWTCSFREITTSFMNKRTIQQTRAMLILPGGQGGDPDMFVAHISKTAGYRLDYNRILIGNGT